MKQGKTKKLYDAIRNQDRSHAGAKAHLDYIRETLLRETNEKIEKAVIPREILPNLVIETGLIDQCRHAARITSKKFQQPTEVSGFCSGEIDENTWYIQDFHTYGFQTCSKTRTQATGFGRILSEFELAKKYILTAHSHNIMDCFHSDEDIQTLTQNILDSKHYKKVHIGDREILIPYACNIVFNEKIQIPGEEPFIQGGIALPQYTLEGMIQKVIFFNYNGTDKLEYKKSKSKRKEYSRIRKEIKQRVHQ